MTSNHHCDSELKNTMPATSASGMASLCMGAMMGCVG